MPARTATGAWRRRALGAVTGIGLGLAIAGCSPYDPSLPDKPFVCASTEPRCPDGYACVADGKRMVCSAGGEPVPDAGTDATAAIAPEPAEPSESTATAEPSAPAALPVIATPDHTAGLAIAPRSR